MVEQTIKVTVPNGYMLVPDSLNDWHLNFEGGPLDGEHLHGLFVDIPRSFGPLYVLKRKEMGAAYYSWRGE